MSSGFWIITGAPGERSSAAQMTLGLAVGSKNLRAHYSSSFLLSKNPGKFPDSPRGRSPWLQNEGLTTIRDAT
jgi:hypothetical protein